MAFLLKAMGFGDSVPNFAFTPEKEPATKVVASATVPWTAKNGRRNEDNGPVTIFSYVLSSGTAETAALARNALSLSKRLRLPGILVFLGGTEHDGTVYVATERCEQLSTAVMADASKKAYYYGSDDTTGTAKSRHGGPATMADFYETAVAAGLEAVGKAVAALHANDLFHGNLCADSVYVNASGFWRLWGLELTNACTTPAPYASIATRMLPPCRAPRQLLDLFSGPAYTGGGMGAEERANVLLVDSYGLGCLVYEALALAKPGANAESRRTLSLQDLRAGKTQLPPDAQEAYDRLLDPNRRRQYSIAQFLSKCDFISESSYVQCLTEMNEMQLWDQAQRDRFLHRIARDIPSFPIRACLHVLLVRLAECVRQKTVSSDVVEPVMQIARRVPDDDEFNVSVAPAIVALYQSEDRALRYQLLQQTGVYAARLSEKVLCEQVWPLFAKGFTNPAPNIREHSARALVALAPRLSAPIMRNGVPKLLQQLQQDADGTIRANATVSLCLVAAYIPEDDGQRGRALAVGFGRMLKDQFLPSRMAALRSFSATLKYMTPKLLSEMVVPGVAPVTVDAEATARDEALRVLEAAVAVLQRNSAALKAHAGPTASADASASSAAPATPSPPPASNSPKAASSSDAGAWGWGGGSSSKAAAVPATATTSHTSPSPVSAVPAVVPQHADPSPRRITPLGPSPTSSGAASPKASGMQPAMSDGWSDGDDDDDDGWGKPKAPAAAPAPKAKLSAPIGVRVLPAASSGMSLSGGNQSGDAAASRPRRKGGLGAAKIN